MQLDTSAVARHAGFAQADFALRSVVCRIAMGSALTLGNGPGRSILNTPRVLIEGIMVQKTDHFFVCLDQRPGFAQ